MSEGDNHGGSMKVQPAFLKKSNPNSLKDEFGLATAAEVIRIMEECESSLPTAEWGCRALSTFTEAAIKTRNAEAMAQFMDDGICECLVNCLNTHAMSSVELAVNGCKIINNLAWTDRELRDFLGEIGGCECIIYVLDLHIGNPDISEFGSAAMMNLCKDHINNSFRLASAGGCESIVQAGNFGLNLRHPKSPIVAANVCTVLAMFCEAANRQRLAECGACELTAALLQFHMETQQVASAAMLALCALASLTEENREVISRASGSKLIVSTIKTHEKHVGICQSGCEAIMHLSLTPDNCMLLVQAGACEVVLSSLKNMLMEVEFGAEVCCGAMLNLVTNGETARDASQRLQEVSAVGVLQKVMSSTRASQRARENAQQLIRNFVNLSVFSEIVKDGNEDYTQTDALFLSRSSSNADETQNPEIEL